MFKKKNYSKKRRICNLCLRNCTQRSLVSMKGRWAVVREFLVPCKYSVLIILWYCFFLFIFNCLFFLYRYNIYLMTANNSNIIYMFQMYNCDIIICIIYNYVCDDT